jgi:hypothetical protein
MNLQNLKYPIIIAVLVIIGLIGYRWHSDALDAAKREQIAKYEGIISQLKTQDSTKTIEATKLKFTIDSAKALLNERDTVVPYRIRTIAINNVKRLNADSSIIFLTNRLK